MCIVNQNFSEAVWKALQKVEEIEEVVILIPPEDKLNDELIIFETNKVS